MLMIILLYACHSFYNVKEEYFEILFLLKSHISAAKPLVTCLSIHIEMFLFCIDYSVLLCG